MQPHELHQHLVGVGRAVECAGARTVVGGHLGLHQLFAADLANRIFLADFGLLVIGDARRHWSGWQEHRWQVSKRASRNHQTRNNLVFPAEWAANVSLSLSGEAA